MLSLQDINKRIFMKHLKLVVKNYIVIKYSNSTDYLSIIPKSIKQVLIEFYEDQEFTRM